MNTFKNYTTLHLHLDWIDVLEVTILLMICITKYVFQTKQEI